MKAEITFTPIYQKPLRPVTVMLGDGAAKPSGDSGWVVVGRPKQKGFTTWEGYGPYTMTVPVFFDKFAEGWSVEAEYEALRHIMRLPASPSGSPSPVRIRGPVPMTNLPWVIQDIDPNESSIIRRKIDGHMVRVAATITLLEYVEADIAFPISPSPAAAASERAGAPAGARTYTVKAGDTLSKIAQTLLGSYKRYPEIAALNGIRDPNRISVGQVLKIP